MMNVAPQNKLTDEQVERLVIAIHDLQVTNIMAQIIWRALEKAEGIEAKRKILVTAFAQSYELMVVMNMAVNSDMKPALFAANLKELKRLSHARVN